VRNQPLTFVEAYLEDDDYLQLLERALNHRHENLYLPLLKWLREQPV